MRSTFDFTATRAFAAHAIRVFLEGPIVILLSVGILFPIFRYELQIHDYHALLVSLSLLLYFFIILKLFVARRLECDQVVPCRKGNLATCVSADVVRHLRHMLAPNAVDLLRAAALSERGGFFLSEIGVAKEDILKRCHDDVHNLDVTVLLADALRVAEDVKESKITGSVLLHLFFQRGGTFESILNAVDLGKDELPTVLRWEQFHAKEHHYDHVLSPRRLVRTFGAVGRAWVVGYMHLLDSFTEDLTKLVTFGARREVILHEKEIESALHVLSRGATHNVLVLGVEGAGKRTFAENVAHILRKREVEQGKSVTRVLRLKTAELLSGTQNPDHVLLAAMKAAEKSGSIVLVVPDIALLLTSNNQNVVNVFGEFLRSKRVFVLGLADTREYHRSIKPKSALDTLFEKIPLEEPSLEETMTVLMEHYFTLEDREHVHVTYKGLRAIVDLADRYITRGAFPGKAVSLLEDAALAAKHAGERTVTEEHIRDMVSIKVHMNVKSAGADEKERLMRLEEILAHRIVGQRQAIQAVVNALKRARLDVASRSRPLGTFLFLGPTGVGKTQTAKVLADEYFGDVGRLVRLDMNEYGSEESVAGIIGAPTGTEGSEGYLLKAVQDHPFSVVLLDEVEKAHKKVLNLFLQVLDEGFLTDSFGIRTDFRSCVIIATSNAGALFIRNFVTKHASEPRDIFKKALVDHLITEGSYSPEFLNRFDEVIVFEPLTEEEAMRIAIMLLDDVVRVFHQEKGITVTVDADAVRAIAKKGYSAEFGAREMRRAVTDTIETYLANVLLTQGVKRGGEIQVTKEALGLERGGAAGEKPSTP